MAKQGSKYHREPPSLDIYLREISVTPLLTADEEVRLTKRIKQGDKRALEKLTKANLRFVVSVAKHFQFQGLSLSDLISEGNVGLIKAAKRFDETRGFKFISYAVWWIRQAILQALADQSRPVRLPMNRVGMLFKVRKAEEQLVQVHGRKPSDEEVAAKLEVSLAEVIETRHIGDEHSSLDAPMSNGNDTPLVESLTDLYQPDPDARLDKAELQELIEKTLDTLTSREAQVICLCYGIGTSKPLTLEEIGKHFGFTRERARQIKATALRRLRHASRSRELRIFFDKYRPN